MADFSHSLLGDQHRHEVRASRLRAPLLYLQEKWGKRRVEKLLDERGLHYADLEQDSTWLSLGEVIGLLEDVQSLSGGNLQSRLMKLQLHPRVIGLHLELLRNAQSPADAYRYLAEHSNESWRVGEFFLEELSECSCWVRYTPDEETWQAQESQLLAELLQAELRSYPLLFGLRPASLRVDSCVSRGDLNSLYELNWQLPKQTLPQTLTLLGALVGFLTSLEQAWGHLDHLQNWWSIAWISLTTALLSGGVGKLYQTFIRRSMSAARQANWLAALEATLAERDQDRALAAQIGSAKQTWRERGNSNAPRSAPGAPLLEGARPPKEVDLSGRILSGKYRIWSKIGRGGVGTVYAAHHLNLRIDVAIKLLRGAAAKDAAEVARLRREARIQMALEHPNVVRTFDLEQMPDGSLFLVMELLHGESLQARLDRSGPLSTEEALPIFIQVARGLGVAHRHHVVHRDLKPANIFLTESRGVKVLDFGMSHLVDSDRHEKSAYTLGTPEYMSPEQCRGDALDHRCDIYALGIVFHLALTGQLPFRAQTRREMIEEHLATEPRSLRSLRPDLNIPATLDQFVLQCLKKNPSERPPDAMTVDRILSALRREEEVSQFYPLGKRDERAS